MKKIVKICFFITGLAAVVVIGLGAKANFSGFTIYINDTFKDPTNVFLLVAAAIGFGSFLRKFVNDVYQWFTTGLNEN